MPRNQTLAGCTRPFRAVRPLRAVASRPALMAGALMTVLAGCDEPLDFDLRDRVGKGRALDTSSAALNATAVRPDPDDRGIISYPNYQVAVARRGDTLASLSARVGADAAAVGRYNGILPQDALREGEIVALPVRVAEPSPATGAIGTGPIQPPNSDITAMAGAAIDRAGVTTTTLAPAAGSTAAPASVSGVPARTAPVGQTGFEPARHKVAAGETAFIIARRYGVTVASLAEWNGLGADYALREGQILLIPPQAATRTVAAATPAPGAGSPTPTPPSAAAPLPPEKTVPKVVETAAAAAAAAKLDKPEVVTQQDAAPSGRLAYPVRGDIIREYSKGRHDGIKIAAATGTAVKAADAGTVAAITRNTENVPIVVVRHEGGLLTVYANVADLSIEKGDTVARGQSIAKVRAGSPSYVHFEVRKGFESVDPVPYLTGG